MKFDPLQPNQHIYLNRLPSFMNNHVQGTVFYNPKYIYNIQDDVIRVKERPYRMVYITFAEESNPKECLIFGMEWYLDDPTNNTIHTELCSHCRIPNNHKKFMRDLMFIIAYLVITKKFVLEFTSYEEANTKLYSNFVKRYGGYEYLNLHEDGEEFSWFTLSEGLLKMNKTTGQNYLAKGQSYLAKWLYSDIKVDNPIGHYFAYLIDFPENYLHVREHKALRANLILLLHNIEKSCNDYTLGDRSSASRIAEKYIREAYSRPGTTAKIFATYSSKPLFDMKKYTFGKAIYEYNIPGNCLEQAILSCPTYKDDPNGPSELLSINIKLSIIDMTDKPEEVGPPYFYNDISISYVNGRYLLEPNIPLDYSLDVMKGYE